jgi:CRP/FNR family transcriptional regulator, cyclic AMP receptor protein
MSPMSWLGRLRAQSPAERTSHAIAAAQKRAYLQSVDILRDLDPAGMDDLERSTRMTTARKGQVLYTQTERPEALFLLKKGRVQLYRLSPQGKKLALAILEAGTFFGEMPLVGETMRHTFAEVIDDALLCVMSRADLERLVLAHPRVGLRMLDVIGRRLAESEAQREELAFRSVQSRIAATLLRLSEQRDDATIAITHQDLGDMVGAYRETVTNALNDMNAADVVSLARGRVVVRDRAALRAQAEE